MLEGRTGQWNDSTNKAGAFKWYCIDKNRLCEYASTSGFCKVTACVNGQIEETIRRANADGCEGCAFIDAEKAAIEALRQPEVIRCKDCKHYNNGDCDEMPKLVSADDYCSWAERRGE